VDCYYESGTDVLARLANFIQTLAGTLGGPGLALVAFADSSFISLPEVADVLLVVQVVKDPHWWWYYGALVTGGSVIGCMILYELARRGGEAFLKKGFSQSTIDKSFVWFKKFGLLAIILPSICPPPVPLKIFILLAGMSGMSRLTFLVAITSARALRYMGEAFLALRYGRDALAIVQQNLGRVAVALTGVLVIIGIVWLWRRRRAATAVVD
jgi:membrane protein YqaA with SNARE-associated domain